MQQFVLYRRVSTKEQGKSGLGLSAQQRDLDLFLTNHAETPFEIIGDFEDVLSGADNSRPALTAAIDLCRKTGATLLVAKLDRLSRKVSFIATLMEDPKLTFRVASIPMASKIELHLYAMLAEQERDFISLRTKAALAEAKVRRKLEGKPTLGGLRPKTEERNKAIQANAEARADKVALTVQPLRAQGATLREIAEALNTSGVATARGGRWQASQVKRVLERLEG
jgi:DNA invertase Pin-like site-specific DNA recombinase